MSSESILTDKHIILGVTGSIAAYKACTIASQLTQHGALVDVIMTDSATRFVAPLTFQALTGRPVYATMWQTGTSGGMGTHIAHVGLAHEADLLLIVPITANTMAKMAHGLADDLLSVTALAAVDRLPEAETAVRVAVEAESRGVARAATPKLRGVSALNDATRAGPSPRGQNAAQETRPSCWLQSRRRVRSGTGRASRGRSRTRHGLPLHRWARARLSRQAPPAENSSSPNAPVDACHNRLLDQ